MTAIATGAIASLSGFLWGPEGLALPGSILAVGLSWAAVVDADRMVLPSLLTIGLLLSGLLVAAICFPDRFIDRAAGAIAGYAVLVLAAHVYRSVRKRDGLGRGDAKLLAAGGAWLGWLSLPYILAGAAACALAWVAVRSRDNPRRFDSRLAFGPFIALSIWLGWLCTN
jgi:prepilin signal peptidase PulO-like enzyme (type II secretory pathway)